MPARADDETDVLEPAPVEPQPVTLAAGTEGSSRGRMGVLAASAIALAIAVGAGGASMAGASAPSSTTTTDPAAPANGGVVAPLAAAIAPNDDDDDDPDELGRNGPRGGRDITITAISGNDVSLKTDDGWTRTITLSDDVKLTKAGVDIEPSALAVGDQVRFRQTRNDDGTYTVTALAVVVPGVRGTVGAVESDSFTVKTRDGSTWTITTNGTTVYRFGTDDGTRADVVAGETVRVKGTANGDNALTALSVTVAADHVAGRVTAKTTSTITITNRKGTSVTIHVDADTTYHVRGVENATLADVAVDQVLTAAGRARADGSLDANVVASGKGRGDRNDRKGGSGNGPKAKPTPTPATGS